jgi:predicted amino acid racemase
VSSLCRSAGVSFYGVTKVTAGDPEVGKAMLRGGADGLADARLANLRRLRQGGLDCPLLLLRAPSPDQAEETVQVADFSVESSLSTLEAVDTAAAQAGTIHRVLLAVESGDLREGLMPSSLLEAARFVRSKAHLRLAGLASNFSCLSGVLPDPENTSRLVLLGQRVGEVVGYSLEIISGGATVNLALLEQGTMPAGINHLRVGEAIICGTDTSGRRIVPGTRQDTAHLGAQVIEVEEKPSLPWGPLGVDAFGGTPHFNDRGLRNRAILALGRIDCDPGDLWPLEPGVEIVGASSDHMVVDVTERPGATAVGEILSFRAGYHAILRACTSPYVQTVYRI